MGSVCSVCSGVLTRSSAASKVSLLTPCVSRYMVSVCVITGDIKLGHKAQKTFLKFLFL